MNDLLISNQSFQRITDNEEIPKYLINKYKFQDLNIEKVYDKLSISINQTGNI